MNDYLSQVVLYGGIPVRRVDVEQHLDHIGVEGPARLVYGQLEPVDREPTHRWNDERNSWEDI